MVVASDGPAFDVVVVRVALLFTTIVVVKRSLYMYISISIDLDFPTCSLLCGCDILYNNRSIRNQFSFCFCFF